MSEDATRRLVWDVPVHGACDVLVVGGGSAGIAAALTKAGPGMLPATMGVDCSADGDVAVRAGAPFTTGRASDGKMMPPR